MEEIELTEENINAFNIGYVMESYEPELLKKITTEANKQNEFVQHISLGARQLRKEQLIAQQKKVLPNINNKKYRR